MFDIDTQISKMVSQLPQPPAAVLPKDMCDKPFMAPQAPAHYVLKAFGNNPDFIMKIGGQPHPDTSRYGCSNSVRVIPHRSIAVVNAGDVGHPAVLMFRPGSQSLPRELLIKNVSVVGDKWHKFEPSKGHTDAHGNLVTVETPRKPHMYPTNYPNIMNAVDRSNKEWAIEFLGSFGPQKA